MIRIVSMDKIFRFTNTLITISIFTLGFKSNTEVEVVAAVVVVVVAAFLSWILGTVWYIHNCTLTCQQEQVLRANDSAI